MTVIQLIGLAASLSFLSGWRVYLCLCATGLAMRGGWVGLPEHLSGLQVLASPWVIGASAVAALCEFFADKIAWIDSLWDAVHSAIRPIGGALLAMAVIDAQDPAWQAASFILGGGAALAAHGAKAGTRALVNMSPEPFSNVAVSGSEDIAGAGMLALALANPVAAVMVGLVVSVGSIGILLGIRRALKRLLPVQSSASR